MNPYLITRYSSFFSFLITDGATKTGAFENMDWFFLSPCFCFFFFFSLNPPNPPIISPPLGYINITQTQSSWQEENSNNAHIPYKKDIQNRP